MKQTGMGLASSCSAYRLVYHFLIERPQSLTMRLIILYQTKARSLVRMSPFPPYLS